MKPHSKIWIYLFFLVSGATGLIYEVVWTRLLTLVMGNTQYSVATVLTAFMGGLAIGSAIIGKKADETRNPVRLYGWLELFIGLLARKLFKSYAIAAMAMLFLAIAPLHIYYRSNINNHC